MKKWIWFLLIAGILGGGYGYYLYQKPKANMTDVKTDTYLQASELVAEFEKDEAAAEIKYLDKTMEIQGVVKEVNESGIILEGGNDLVGVLCEFENQEDIANVEPQKNVKIKGICTGKLLDVVLSRCIIIE